MHQINRPPFEGRFDPAAWQPGEQVRDTFRLDIPGGLAGQTLQLYLALCSPDTDRCLPVSDQGHSLYLGEVENQ